MMAKKLDYVVLLVTFLALWQALYFVVGSDVISAPMPTLGRAIELLGTRPFWVHAANTGQAFIIAVLISSVAGIVIGLWLGFHRFAGDVADPILSTLYSIPKITLYPLILLMFGLGISAKIAFGVIHGIFPIMIFTMNAVRNVSPIYYRTARIMKMPPVTIAMTIMTPAALPEILSGIRIGVALTLLGTLIGELFASTAGIGFVLIRAMDIHAVVDILALATLIFMFAATINALLGALERRVRRNV
jgi:NitT/TauT family transport system permease protein